MPAKLALLQNKRFDDLQKFQDSFQPEYRQREQTLEIEGASYRLFPGFHEPAHDLFERQYDYDTLLKVAREQSSIEVNGAADGLKWKGYQVLQAMTPENARKWCDVIRKETSTKPNERRFKVESREIARRDETLLAFADDLITDELEHLVEQFFESHFYVLFMHFNRVIPFRDADDAEDISFKWHNDGATPRQYVKFLYMLNGFDGHQGGTSVLDRENTARLGDAGYTYCPVDDRVEDIGPICRHFDIPYEPEYVKFEAGQGVLFQPATVLHKGMAPAKGPRYGGQVAFIPHPRPWRDTIKENLKYIREMTDGAFSRVVAVDKATREELAAGYISVGEVAEPSGNDRIEPPAKADAPEEPSVPFSLLYESRHEDFQDFMDGYKSHVAGSSRHLDIDGAPHVLVPDFLAWAKERFESRYHYDLLLREAQSLSGINADGTADGLRQKGYQAVQAMTPEAARKWRDVIEKETSTKPNERRFKVESREIARRNESLLAFADDLITDELEHLVEQYFQSHFYVMFMHFNRVIPFDQAEDAADVSFKWHVDADVPEAYVKFLFMLNGFDEHQGGTSFLDRETAAKLDEIGYTRCGARHRVEDLAPLCGRFDIPFQPEYVKFEAGQGVLFQPSSVLHKGMAPAKGPRYGGQVAFIPHPRPWRETFKKNLAHIREMSDGAFPRVVPVKETPDMAKNSPHPPAPKAGPPAQDAPTADPNGAPEKPFRVEIKKELNPVWKEFNDKNVLTLEPLDYLKPESKVFSMGSCFAVEIRTALIEAGLDVYPKYRDMTVDHERHIIGGLPHRDNLNHYHTFAIRQEFEKYHGIWTQDEGDYWEVPDHWWKTQKTIYQDPYRRSIFGKTPKYLMDAVKYLDEVVAKGMEAADVFLITLGLIEVWRKKDNGLHSCEFPGYNMGGGHDNTVFHLSTFQENYDNVKETVRLIRKINAKAEIVFTVSPVWLGRTFTENDVYVANMESKSQLRAVAGQVCREEKNVHYFPSFEIATALHGKGHSEDGRHVREQTVFEITSAFMLAHSNGAVRRQPPQAAE